MPESSGSAEPDFWARACTVRRRHTSPTVRRQRTRGLSPAQQALDLRSRFGTSTVSLSAAELAWTGTIEPTALSREYPVPVTYRREHPPQTGFLTAPETRSGQSLPH